MKIDKTSSNSDFDTLVRTINFKWSKKAFETILSLTPNWLRIVDVLLLNLIYLINSSKMWSHTIKYYLQAIINEFDSTPFSLVNKYSKKSNKSIYLGQPETCPQLILNDIELHWITLNDNFVIFFELPKTRYKNHRFLF